MTWHELLDAYEQAIEDAARMLDRLDEPVELVPFSPPVGALPAPTPADARRFATLRARASEVTTDLETAMALVRRDLGQGPTRRQAARAYVR